METIRRTLNSQVRIDDSPRGICTFIASDATIDSYGEIIRADAWRHDHFKKNAPVLADHDYRLEKQIGKVIQFGVKGGKLIETVQFAIDVPENELAQLVWKMVVAGYIKACSVGFWPERVVRPGDSDWAKQLKELNVDPDARVNCIYTRVQQIELSIVCIGANPNALTQAYKSGVLSLHEMKSLRATAAHHVASGWPETNPPAVREMLAVLRRAAQPKRDPVSDLLSAFRS